MADITHLFGGRAFDPRSELSDYGTPEQQFVRALTERGFDPPSPVRFDGEIHRFGPKKRHWYVAWSNGVPAGCFGDWGENQTHQWRSNIGREMTSLEQIQYSQNLENIRKRRERAAEVASNSVAQIWADLAEAPPAHPYLDGHGIQAHGVRVTGDGRLMIPAYNHDREIASAQYIDQGGAKRFHTGGAMGGAVWWVGDLTGEYETTYIAEGFATAAAIYEETGCLTVVSFSAHNLPKAAEFTRKVRGEAQSVVVVADNDSSGTGQFYASQAVATHGGRWVMPPQVGDDACDFRLSGGDLKALLDPSGSGFLMSGAEAALKPPAVSWLVRGWLARETVTMIHGASGIGKSFFVLDMALRIATGTERWNGARVNQAPIVYIAGEGLYGTRLRMAAWLQVHGKTPQDLDGSFWISREGCDLDTSEGLSRVMGELHALPVQPGMIIVDTLHRSMSGDENSAQDAGAVVRACDRMRQEFGACVTLIHHQGHTPGRPRGSTAWKGAMETEISLERGEGMVVAKNLKQKDAPEAEPVSFSIEPYDLGYLDDEGEPVVSAYALEVGPPPPPTPKEDEKWRLFERAWWATGCEDVKGVPYVSRGALRNWLKAEGWSDVQVKNALRPDQAHRLVGHLLDTEMIAPELHGWCVVAPVQASALMARRETK